MHGQGQRSLDKLKGCGKISMTKQEYEVVITALVKSWDNVDYPIYGDWIMHWVIKNIAAGFARNDPTFDIADFVKRCKAP